MLIEIITSRHNSTQNIFCENVNEMKFLIDKVQYKLTPVDSIIKSDIEDGRLLLSDVIKNHRIFYIQKIGYIRILDNKDRIVFGCKLTTLLAIFESNLVSVKGLSNFVLTRPEINQILEEVKSVNTFPLKHGSSGQEVKNFQKYLLVFHSYSCLPRFGPDGIWGDELQSVVNTSYFEKGITKEMYDKIIVPMLPILNNSK